GYNNFDVRHTFNVSALYSLPIGRGRRVLGSANGFTQALAGNWQIGTIFNGRSGLPLELKVVRPDVAWLDGNGTVFGTQASTCGTDPDTCRTAVINTPGGGASRNVRRPDVIPGVDPFLDDGRRFLNPAAFATPAPGAFGNY